MVRMRGEAGSARVPLVVGGAAVVVLAVGLVGFLGGRAPLSSGWYAYSPLTDPASIPPALDGAVMWSRRQLVGAGLVVLGLVLGAAAGGYLLGRRRRPTG